MDDHEQEENELTRATKAFVDKNPYNLVRPTKPPILDPKKFGWTSPDDVTITPPKEKKK
jgi:hypothetical protein